jgi:hypothetical protein
MIDTATARRAVATRVSGRRRSPRSRRLRTLGAAGFAGVSVALLAAEHPDPPPASASRFSANALVTGLVAVPVRFADPGSAAFLRPGDHIDVLAADDSGQASSRSVPDPLVPVASDPGTAAATDVSVLEITGPGIGPTPPRTGSEDTGLVFLAVDNPTAARLARAAVRGHLSFALHPSPGLAP